MNTIVTTNRHKDTMRWRALALEYEMKISYLERALAQEESKLRIAEQVTGGFMHCCTAEHLEYVFFNPFACRCSREEESVSLHCTPDEAHKHNKHTLQRSGQPRPPPKPFGFGFGRDPLFPATKQQVKSVCGVCSAHVSAQPGE